MLLGRQVAELGSRMFYLARQTAEVPAAAQDLGVSEDSRSITPGRCKVRLSMRRSDRTDRTLRHVPIRPNAREAWRGDG